MVPFLIAIVVGGLLVAVFHSTIVAPLQAEKLHPRFPYALTAGFAFVVTSLLVAML